jgi:hypothetical protein
MMTPTGADIKGVAAAFQVQNKAELAKMCPAPTAIIGKPDDPCILLRTFLVELWDIIKMPLSDQENEVQQLEHTAKAANITLSTESNIVSRIYALKLDIAANETDKEHTAVLEEEQKKQIRGAEAAVQTVGITMDAVRSFMENSARTSILIYLAKGSSLFNFGQIKFKDATKEGGVFFISKDEKSFLSAIRIKLPNTITTMLNKNTGRAYDVTNNNVNNERMYTADPTFAISDKLFKQHPEPEVVLQSSYPTTMSEIEPADIYKVAQPLYHQEYDSSQTIRSTKLDEKEVYHFIDFDTPGGNSRTFVAPPPIDCSISDDENNKRIFSDTTHIKKRENLNVKNFDSTIVVKQKTDGKGLELGIFYIDLLPASDPASAPDHHLRGGAPGDEKDEKATTDEKEEEKMVMNDVAKETTQTQNDFTLSLIDSQLKAIMRRVYFMPHLRRPGALSFESCVKTIFKPLFGLDPVKIETLSTFLKKFSEKTTIEDQIEYCIHMDIENKTDTHSLLTETCYDEWDNADAEKYVFEYFYKRLMKIIDPAVHSTLEGTRESDYIYADSVNGQGEDIEDAQQDKCYTFALNASSTDKRRTYYVRSYVPTSLGYVTLSISANEAKRPAGITNPKNKADNLLDTHNFRIRLNDNKLSRTSYLMSNYPLIFNPTYFRQDLPNIVTMFKKTPRLQRIANNNQSGLFILGAGMFTFLEDVVRKRQHLIMKKINPPETVAKAILSGTLSTLRHRIQEIHKTIISDEKEESTAELLDFAKKVQHDIYHVENANMDITQLQKNTKRNNRKQQFAESDGDSRASGGVMYMQKQGRKKTVQKKYKKTHAQTQKQFILEAMKL